MKRYTPAYTGTVTVYIFIESTDFTPEDIAVRAYEIAPRAMVKETCFGLEVTGKPEEVEEIVGKIRAFDPAHIFVKDRGFPPGQSQAVPGEPRGSEARVPWPRVRALPHRERLPGPRGGPPPDGCHGAGCRPWPPAPPPRRAPEEDHRGGGVRAWLKSSSTRPRA